MINSVTKSEKYNEETIRIREYEEKNFYKFIIYPNIKYYIEILKESLENNKIEQYEKIDIYKILLRYKDFKEDAQFFKPDNNIQFSSKYTLTLKTIEWYARKKSPKNYKLLQEIIKKSLREKLLDNPNNEINEILIAQYIYFEIHIFFAYDSLNNILYYYAESEHRWILDSNFTIVSDEIIKNIIELSKELERHAEQINSRIQEIQSKEVKSDEDSKTIEKLNDIKNRIPKILGKLNKINIIKNFKKIIIESLTVHNLNSIMDSNPAITGTKNCVIEIIPDDMKQGKYKAIYRDGKPEDYINKSTNIYLITEPIESVRNDKYMIKLTNWLRKVFVDECLLKYFMKVCASFLFRKNREKLFFILTGSGDNSKSAIKKLIENTLGDYAFTLPNNFLARKENTGNHKTELHSTKSRAVCFIQENDVTDVLISGKIKELTGNDTVYSRELYQKGENHPINFRCFLMCNDIPPFTNIDYAFKRRIVIIPFLSKWSDKPPETKEERYQKRIFKLKNNFEDLIPYMSPYFLYLLYHYYEIYEREGISPSEDEFINKQLNEFWNDHDPYIVFSRQYIMKEKDHDLSLDSLVRNFKDWLERFFYNTKITIKRDTIKYGFERVLETKCINRKFENFTCTYDKNPEIEL